MDVQGTKPDTQQWPQQRAPKRKRGKKKSKAAKLAFPEPRLLHEDQDRARCERKLLADTQARLRHMDADRNRELAHLFRNKSSLPVGQRERAEDDHLRRVAVREIMEAREKAGIEPVGEAVLWAGVSTDITNELRKKFPKHHFSMIMLSPTSMISSVHGPLTLPVQRNSEIEVQPGNPSAGSWTGFSNSQIVGAFRLAALNGSDPC